MSGVYALVMPDRVELLTDGAVINSEGVLRAVQSKVTPLGDLPAVATSRGNYRACQDAKDAIDDIFSAPSVTFDEAIVELGTYLSKMGAEGDHGTFDMIVAGYSGSDGPALFWFQSTPNLAEWPGWKLRRITTGLKNQYPAPVEWRDSMVKSGGIDDKGLYLMTQLRAADAVGPAVAGSIVKDRDATIVGGMVELTTIDAGGVTTRLLHRWPDEIGERLAKHPIAHPSLVTSAAAMKRAGFQVDVPMNRKERKAAEAMARRKAT